MDSKSGVSLALPVCIIPKDLRSTEQKGSHQSGPVRENLGSSFPTLLCGLLALRKASLSLLLAHKKTWIVTGGKVKVKSVLSCLLLKSHE